MKRILHIILISCLFFSCKKSDKEIILGRWQSERDWFEFKENQTYSSGKDDLQMVDKFKYTIDPERKELNLYTDEKSTTYYLIYEFKGSDTLSVRNAMSTNKTMIDFIRVKTSTH